MKEKGRADTINGSGSQETMTPKDIRHVSSFSAVGEDGRTETIHVFVDVLDAGTRADPNAGIEGLKLLRTDTGDAVNRLEKGEYEVVATGEILRSDDPNAP